MHCSLSALPEVYLGHCVYYHSTSQYMNHELSDVQAGFGKGRRARDQITNIRWILKKQESSIYFCFIDCGEVFDCVDHNKLWKIP